MYIIHPEGINIKIKVVKRMSRRIKEGLN